VKKKRVVEDIPIEGRVKFLQHPVEFVEYMILGLTPDEIKANVFGRRLEPESKSIIYNVGKHDYVSVHSGKGITKSFSLAVLAIWFLWSRSHARVAVTGPKFDQLKITLWAEIHKWLSISKVRDELVWSSEGLRHVDPKMDSFGFMLTSKDTINIQGVHGDHVLWMADEASNVEDEMIDTIMGGMNDPEAKIVMTGNPNRASGGFFNTWNRDKDMWKILHFSSEDSARANPVWLKKMSRHPRESDYYRVNVLGLPPRGNPKAIISLEECNAARDRNVKPGDFLEMGLDPAAEGNDLTAIAIRQGNKLLEIRVFAKTKAPEVCGHTLNMLREYRAKTGIQSKVRIKVDDHAYGNAIRHFLALNTTDNIEVVPCLFGGGGNEAYKDDATIMWYGMRDVINQTGLTADEDLIEELSTREWNYVGGNKMQVEPKGKWKERFNHSPDRADACILCFAYGAKKIFVREETEEANVKSFEIDWYNEKLADPAFDGALMVEAAHYVALVLNKDLSFNGLAAVYQFIQDKLWIYAEFLQESPVPDVLAKMIKYQAKIDTFHDDRDARVLGNEAMFRKDGDRRPLAEILRQEGLNIVDSSKYDEYGAIAMGAKMFRKSKVEMHESLELSRSQITLWAVKNGKVDIEENGFCKAFLLILSEVRKQQKVRPSPIKAQHISQYSGKPLDYHDVHEPKVKKENPHAWMSR